jgi:F1F0 ATPase subunit 2
MTWVAALTTGAGVGLAYFFGLWLTVRQVIRGPRRNSLMVWSRMARLALVMLAFYALSRQGPAFLVMGLTGFWLTRGYLICRLGGEPHAQ